jgi:hypothetical protein
VRAPRGWGSLSASGARRSACSRETSGSLACPPFGHCRRRARWLGAACLAGLLTACALQPAAPPGPSGQCREFFAAVDQAVSTAGVEDVQAARISGFPYLRVDRFLASFPPLKPDTPEYAAWVDRLQSLGARGRDVELANLPEAARAGLRDRLPAGMDSSLASAARQCATVLRDHDLAQPDCAERLELRAHVPDDYRTWERALGLYPLTAPLFAHGIGKWHAETLASYARPVRELQVAGRLVSFRPPQERRLTADQVADVIRRASGNPLHIPEPSGADRDRLFDAFAPVWRVDVAGDHDLIGAPKWGKSSDPQVDLSAPVVYRHLSHTRMDGQILLQLNYVVWFSSRPKTSAFDLLGGRLDGIIWRVTLSPEGRPLVYDTIHDCGCYHLFFPTSHLRLRSHGFTVEETAFVPQYAPDSEQPHGLVLRVANGTHYIERVLADSVAAGPSETYRFADYDSLRSLPAGSGRRSLFGPDGIVPGTERGERCFFWPMGIPSPGAMRQWGHHATAFVGRRHFDDPDLMERYFVWHQ